MIKQLPANVQSYIRSGVAITSVTQCVEELLLNSVDAGAKCIAIRVDLSCFRIQVVDNGCGIAVEELDKVGQRYSTSKCQSIEDLDSLNYYGYRGEALASLCNISSLLEINTRTQLSAQTYTKIFQHGKPLSTIDSKSPRPSPGTTVTLHNLFYNLPVRQKTIRLSLELEHICHRVEALALLQPKLSITLRNDTTGSVILQTHKTNSLLSTFSYLFGSAKSQSLCDVSHSSGYFSLNGYIGRDSYYRKDIQFIYINRRLVLNTKIHKVMNKVLKKSLILKQKTSETSDMLSPSKLSKKYPMFLLNIKCPLNVYDITFDPRKTMVEFIEMEQLLHIVEEMCWKFLKKENLMTVDSITSESKNDSKFELNKNNQSPLEFGIRDPDKVIEDNIEDQVYDNVKSRAFKSQLIKRKLFKTNLTEGQNYDSTDLTNIPTKFSKNDHGKVSGDSDHGLAEKQIYLNATDLNMKESFTEHIDETFRESIITPVQSGLKSSRSLLTESVGILIKTPSTVDFVPSEKSKFVEDAERNILPQRKTVTDVEEKLQCNISRSTATKSNISLLSEFRMKRNNQTRVPSEMKPSTRSILNQFRSIKPTRLLSLAGTKSSLDVISESLNLPIISKTTHLGRETEFSYDGNKILSKEKCVYEIPSSEHLIGDPTTMKHEGISTYHKTISSNLSIMMKKSEEKTPARENIDNRHSYKVETLIASKDKNDSTLTEKPDKILALNNDCFVIPEYLLRGNEDGIGLLNKCDKKYTSLKQNQNTISVQETCKNAVKGLSLKQSQYCHNSGDCHFLTSSSFLQPYKKKERNVKLNLKISHDLKEYKYQNLNLNCFANHTCYSYDDHRRINNNLSNYNTRKYPATLVKSFQGCDTSSNSNYLKVFNSETKPDEDTGLGKTQNFNTMGATNVCLNSHLNFKESDSAGQGKQLSSLIEAAFSTHGDNTSELSQDIQNSGDLNVINCVSFSSNKFLSDSNFSLFQNAFESRTEDKIKAECLEGNFNSEFFNRIFSSEKDNADSYSLKNSDCSLMMSMPSKYEECLPAISDEETKYHNASSCSSLHNDSSDLQMNNKSPPHCRTVDVAEKVLSESDNQDLCNPTEPKKVERIPFHIVLLNNYGSDDNDDNDNGNKEEIKSTAINCKDLSQQMSDSQSINNCSNIKEQLKVDSMQNSTKESVENPNIPNTYSDCSEPQRGNIIKTHTLETYEESEISECNPSYDTLEESLSSVSKSLVNLKSTTRLQVQSDFHPLSESTSTKSSNTVHTNENSSVRFDVNYDSDIVNEKSKTMINESNLNKLGLLNSDVLMSSKEPKAFGEQPVIGSCSIAASNTRVSLQVDMDVIDNGQLVENSDDCRNQTVDEEERSYQQKIETQSNTKGDQARENSSPFSNSMTAVNNKTDSSININQLHCLNIDSKETVGICSSPSSVTVDSYNSHQVDNHSLWTDNSKITDSCNSLPLSNNCLNEHRNQTDDNYNDLLPHHCVNLENTELVYKPSSTNEINVGQDVTNVIDTVTIEELTNNSLEEDKTFLECDNCDLAIKGHGLISMKQSNLSESVNFNSDNLTSLNSVSATNQFLPRVTSDTVREIIDAGSFSVNLADSSNKAAEIEKIDSTEETDPVIKLWNRWQNPVFQCTEKEILNTWSSNSKNTKHHRVVHQCQFTKAMLQQIETVGQVDKKFIACTVHSRDSSAKTPDQLIIIDQHAAHERVRLEQLTKEMYQTDNGTDGNNNVRISHSNIFPPLVLTFSDREIRVINSFLPEFHKMGMELTVSVTDNKVQAHTAPSCIMTREASEIKYNRRSVIKDLMQALIKEQIELLQDTHGARRSVPQIIHNVLCSQACHSAIKFGTVLTLKQCKELVKMLLDCKLPFQCAHGRPSMIPLLNLQYFKNSIEHSRKRQVNLVKLREKMKKQQ
ncbi:hypothetical protein Ahia01_000304100 [Argonauta hians]